MMTKRSSNAMTTPITDAMDTGSAEYRHSELEKRSISSGMEDGARKNYHGTRVHVMRF